MQNFGFVRVVAAIPFNRVIGIDYNKKNIVDQIKIASEKNATIVVFPELSIPSYTASDLLNHQFVIEKSLEALSFIKEETKSIPILSIVGLPLINKNKLFNCASVVNMGKILGIVPKSFIPNYKEFYEPRWFSGIDEDYDSEIIIGDEKVKFGRSLLFRDCNNSRIVVGVEICEDLWMPIPPSSFLTQAGATVICNLSASNSLVAKNEYRKILINSQSSKTISAYIYSSSGCGESTTDMVFDSDGIISEYGVTLVQSERFKRDNQIIYADIDIDKLYYERVKIGGFKNITGFEYIDFVSTNKNTVLERNIDPYPFVPNDNNKLDERCKEIFNIQTGGLCKRIESIKDTKCIIGVSGGLDSTLALLIILKSYQILNKKIEDIIAVTMPGFGTTDRTYNNVINLCKKIGVTFLDMDIKDVSRMILDKIEQNENEHNIVYENIQARARTYLLMTLANKYNGIVVGTGDLSEIALGWSTYNGDHISMYNVNCGVPKTLVKFLVRWIADNEFCGKIKDILIDFRNQESY